MFADPGTFQGNKTSEQFFKTNFKKYDNYVKKAVRDNSSHTGRTRGGLAQFVSKEGNIKKERIVSSSSLECNKCMGW